MTLCRKPQGIPCPCPRCSYEQGPVYRYRVFKAELFSAMADLAEAWADSVRLRARKAAEAGPPDPIPGPVPPPLPARPEALS